LLRILPISALTLIFEQSYSGEFHLDGQETRPCNAWPCTSAAFAHKIFHRSFLVRSSWGAAPSLSTLQTREVAVLNNQLLNALFEKLGTPPKGRTLISNARIKAPVRKVRSNSSNVITIIASRKMGCEIRTESRHIEYPA